MTDDDESPSQPRRRRLRWVFVLSGLLLVIGLAWLAVTGLLARRELASAQHNVSQIRAAISAGETDLAVTQAGQLREHARRAHSLTTGPAWWVASELPILGRPVVSARGCTAAADELGNNVLQPLIQVAGSLDLSHLLDHGAVRTQPLVQAAPVVSAASRQLSITSAAVRLLPSSTWLNPVDRARAKFGDSLVSLQSELDSAARVTSVLPQLLGTDGPKRYFVGLENEAESRGLGGIPGAFAIVTADRGRLSFTRFESDTTLTHVKTDLDLGTEYDQRYRAADPTSTYPNSTIGPDFRDAGRIWAAMWQKYSGQKVDGAIAIDPTAISYLLKVTGPAKLADGQQVSSSNVVALTQQSLYQKYPDTAQRKAYLLQIAGAISTRLIGAPGSTKLIKAATRATAERRLLIWSADPSIETVLRQSSVAGTLEPGSGPFAGFTTVNATGGKLDYYLRRSMSYVQSGCGPGESTTSTFTLVNAVPAGPLPAYVTLRSDKPAYPTQPGDNKLLLSYYTTLSSVIRKVTVDGVATIVAPGTEHGFAVFTLPLELKRGSTHTIVVTSQDPARGAVHVLVQPAVNPPHVIVRQPLC